MQVFHYVASQIQDIPLFDAEERSVSLTGAIYNDFDNSATNLLRSQGEELFCYSQVPPSQESTSSHDAIQEALD